MIKRPISTNITYIKTVVTISISFLVPKSFILKILYLNKIQTYFQTLDLGQIILLSSKSEEIPDTELNTNKSISVLLTILNVRNFHKWDVLTNQSC